MNCSNSVVLLDNYELSAQAYTDCKLKPNQFLSSQTYHEKQLQKALETSNSLNPQLHKQKKRKLNSQDHQDVDVVILLRTAYQEIKKKWHSKELSTPETLEGVNILEWYDLVSSMRKFQPVINKIIDISDFQRSNTSAKSVIAEETVLFDCVVHNSIPQDIILHCFNTAFVIPKHTKFLMSDFANIGPLTSSQPEGYHIILIDPPWENISAARANRYNTLPNYELFKIPMPKLSNTSGTLIAMWITNKPKYHKFVTESLFPKWKASHIATWYWLKITSNGELVTDLDCVHRKPYEPLLIGFIPPANQVHHFDKKEHKAIASIVSSHSRKPLIHGLLQSFYQTLVECDATNLNCLEMFARNLVPHWTCWGNQVLHFQHSNFFILPDDTNENNHV